MINAQKYAVIEAAQCDGGARVVPACDELDAVARNYGAVVVDYGPLSLSDAERIRDEQNRAATES